ncbi:unnamed protein product [Owenia fusiformis]|uniref:Uncharacterized protein n=1 Tax=Owenia fusiformis TaxID=6347 RepID=A0A8J1U5E8_OWEFU|nr:unnamed protein product [Owenia fusiformis]
MASATSTQEEKFKDILTCSICLEQFTDPKVLPCLHTFCLGCIDTWATQNQTGKKLPCPICKEQMVVPDGGLKAMKPNFLLNTIQDVLSSTSYQNHQVDNCDICFQDERTLKAEFKCLECTEKLCTNCFKVHSKLKSSKDHKIIKLTGDVAVDISNEMKHLTERSIYCEKHPQQVLTCYCTEDACAICSTCYFTQHSKHSCSDINDEVLRDKKQIEKLLDIARSKQHAMTNHLKSSQKKQRENLKLKINRDRFRVLEHVQDYYDNQVKALDSHFAENTGLFSKQMLEIENFTQYLCSLRDHGHAIEIVNMRKELNKKYEDWSKQTITGDDVQVTGFNCDFLPGLTTEESQSAGETITLGKFLPKPKDMNANKNSAGKIQSVRESSTVRSKHKKSYARALVPTSFDDTNEDESSSDDEFVDCFESTQETAQKEVEVLYSIHVDDRQPKYERCHSKEVQLQAEVKEQTASIACPKKTEMEKHLDATDEGCLAIDQLDEKDDWQGGKKSKKRSNKRTTVACYTVPQKKNRNKTYGVRSIAVKTNGDVAYVLSDVDEVDLCDKAMTFKVTLMDYSRSGYRSVIPLVGNCLGFLDSKSCVNIFGRLDIFHKQIDLKQSIHPYSNADALVPDIRNLAVFKDGNIAVLNKERVQRIHHYNGKPIRYFKITSMKDPVSLTVNSEDIVIVVDKGSHNIKGFHMMSGQPVMSYGKEGNGTGELSSPNDICTDTDNNIIIADTGNKRVHLLDPRGQFKKYILKCPESPLSVAINKDGHLLCGTDVGKIYSLNYNE